MAIGINEYIDVYKLPCNNYKMRKETHDKKKYLVVPVVMMVEGVHNGSHGPLLHPIEELGKFPESWNGIPVVINHPQNTAGQNISANSPQVIDASAVGKVYNTEVDGAKLKSEVWLEEDKLAEVANEILDDVKAGKQIEVSLGVFTEDEDNPGTWNDETYDAIARNHRPDHLALLPGGIGACSIADGCGIGANVNKKGGNNVNDEELMKKIESVCLAGYSINEIGDHAKKGFKETMDAVYTVLRGMDADGQYHYLEELYPDYMVYQKSTKDGSKLYKQEYSLKDGKVEINGNPVEVSRKVDYTPVANGVHRLKFNNNSKEVKTMSEDVKCPDCVKIVDGLIANGRFTEAQRPELEALSKTVLESIAKPEVKEVTIEKVIEVNKISDEDKAALASYRKQLKENRDKLIQKIQDNTEKAISVEELNVMSDATLEKLVVATAKKVEEVTDYSIMSVVNANRGFDEDDEPLYPIGVVMQTKK